MRTTKRRRVNLVAVSIATLVVCCLALDAQADRTIANLADRDVVTRTPSDERLGDYYLVTIDIPDGVTQDNFLSAVLELSMSVDTTVDTVFTEVGDTIIYWNDAPVLEVCALREPMGDVYSENLVDRDHAVRVPAMIGSSRIIRVDITRIVSFFLANPTQNSGLVVGSLSGNREGLFALERDGFGSRVPARLRFDQRRVSREQSR